MPVPVRGTAYHPKSETTASELPDGNWCCKGGPKRSPCKMPATSTERTTTSAPATGTVQEHVPLAATLPCSQCGALVNTALAPRLGRGTQGGHGQLVHGGCPPGQSGWDAVLLAGERKAGCRGTSRAVTLGLQTWPLLFPGLTTAKETGIWSFMFAA